MVKSSALSLRISEDIKRALEAAAEADRRSVASMVEKVLADYLTEAGYLKGDGKAKRKG